MDTCSLSLLPQPCPARLSPKVCPSHAPFPSSCSLRLGIGVSVPRATAWMNSPIQCSEKEARHKRPPAVWCHLCNFQNRQNNLCSQKLGGKTIYAVRSWDTAPSVMTEQRMRGASGTHVNHVSVSQQLCLPVHLVKMFSTVQLKIGAFCCQDLPPGLQASLPLLIHILLFKSVLAFNPQHLGSRSRWTTMSLRASLVYLMKPCLK